MNSQDTEGKDTRDTAQLNADALSLVLAETGATIRADRYRLWRPTVRRQGAISGVSTVRATILATDGNLGLFVDENGHFFGHVQHFSAKVETLYSSQVSGGTYTGPRKPRTKKVPEWQKKADELIKGLGLE